MNRTLLFRRWSALRVGSMVFGLAVAEAHAQVILPNAISGIQYRYRGDTLWRERDTTLIQTVYKADTVFRSTFILGRKASSHVYLVVGDSSRILESRDAAGRFVATTTKNGPALVMLEADRAAIETAFRLTETQERMREADVRMQAMTERAVAMGMNPPPAPAGMPTVPVSPKTKQSYPLSANKLIEQLGDTVRYITGCAARPPVDTTVYLLFATDSVRRLSPAPRSFDQFMALALQSDMNGVLLRQRVRPGDNPAMKNVPKVGAWPCDKR